MLPNLRLPIGQFQMGPSQPGPNTMDWAWGPAQATGGLDNKSRNTLQGIGDVASVGQQMVPAVDQKYSSQINNVADIGNVANQLQRESFAPGDLGITGPGLRRGADNLQAIQNQVGYGGQQAVAQAGGLDGIRERNDQYFQGQQFKSWDDVRALANEGPRSYTSGSQRGMTYDPSLGNGRGAWVKTQNAPTGRGYTVGAGWRDDPQFADMQAQSRGGLGNSMTKEQAIRLANLRRKQRGDAPLPTGGMSPTSPAGSVAPKSSRELQNMQRGIAALREAARVIPKAFTAPGTDSPSVFGGMSNLMGDIMGRITGQLQSQEDAPGMEWQGPPNLAAPGMEWQGPVQQEDPLWREEPVPTHWIYGS